MLIFRYWISRTPFLLAAGWLLGSCSSSSPVGPAPTRLSVAAITPQAGSTTGGTPVTISGTGFAADATVMIGGRPATDVNVRGSTVISATTAPLPNPGPVDVSVTSGGATAILTGRFNLVAPSGANQPPVVNSIKSIGSRNNQPSGFADIDETVTLSATVTDNETPVGSLTFEWTGPGTFTGSGPSVSWRVPAVRPTPSPVTVTLNVTEVYTEGSITHRNVGTGQFVMQVHDSQTEIMDMGEDFLNLFSRSEVPTDVVLHNFSPTCDDGQGRANEAADVDASHAAFVQDSSKARIARKPPVTFNFGGHCPFRFRLADACSSYTVHWEVTLKQGPMAGKQEVTDGIDYVTAVLEQNRWRLCHSDFDGTVQIPSLGIIQHVTR